MKGGDTKTTARLQKKIEDLERQLEEANDTIEAIRLGQIDALVVNTDEGHALYTLRSADHSYRVFIEKMAEGAVTLNTHGLIQYCNSKFAAMVGQPLARMIGSSFFDFVDDKDRLMFRLLFDRGWKEDAKGEVSLASAGKVTPVQLSVNPLELDAGPCLNLIITDLTRQKESEKELVEKNELLVALNEALSKSNYDLQQFASVASHDLQEPLRKIMIFSRFLRDTIWNELKEPSRTHLNKVIASSHRMQTLIRDILSYSRLSAEESHFERVDLGALAQEIVDDFDLKISEKNAVVTVGDLPAADINRGQIRQVFYNLVSNALKFTREGVTPAIEITTRPVDAAETGVSLDHEKDYCRIVIKDNGIGFDEQYAQSIFSLFEKLNPKSQYEGSGIGLSIAKKIIDKHHGLIIAKSKAGEGSEFNIVLPLRHGDNHDT
jgi:PAS domain S-box-containing protein